MPGLFDTHRGMTHMPQQPMGQKGQAVMQYLNDVASGRIAEQGLRQYGDAVQAGMQGNYGQFGGLLGDAMGSGLLAKGIASIPGFGLKTVWHGSPHKWDVPDISKVGTGEGAQAYGHGFYSAESPGVAKSYQESLAGTKTGGLINDATYRIGDQIVPQSSLAKDDVDIIEQILRFHKGNADDAYLSAKTDYENAVLNYGESDPSVTKFKKYFDKLADYKGYNIELDQGHLYKLDIPDEDIPKYLDWDKPLSEQSEEVKKIFTRGDTGKFDPAYADLTGAQLYAKGQSQFGGSDKYSEFLASQGVPGIRYLDQASRGAGEGTSNFVTFDPSRIKVLERN